LQKPQDARGVRVCFQLRHSAAVAARGVMSSVYTSGAAHVAQIVKSPGLGDAVPYGSVAASTVARHVGQHDVGKCVVVFINSSQIPHTMPRSRSQVKIQNA
jgi:hypothetical protein